MARVDHELLPAVEVDVNRLVVGDQSLCVESFEPLGDVLVRTPSRSRVLHHAARANVRCGSGRAVFLYGEAEGLLVGVRAA
jgi:hypothetical protein